MKLWTVVMVALGMKPDEPGPKCKRCGHEPCPGCENWCDRLIRNIYCPECDEVVCEQGNELDGRWMGCPHCKNEWQLLLVKTGRKIDDIGIDACCDHECDWDQDEADVIRWCEWKKGI